MTYSRFIDDGRGLEVVLADGARVTNDTSFDVIRLLDLHGLHGQSTHDHAAEAEEDTKSTEKDECPGTR